MQMSGALLQLALAGTSTGHFVLDKGASPWLFRWQKTTNFALEAIKQDFSTEPGFGKRCSVIIGRLGDLLAGVTLEVAMTSQSNEYPKCVASYHPIEALVKEVSYSIGGTLIERHTSDFFRVYDTFLRDPCKSAIYRSMTNFDIATINTAQNCTETLVLPLMFTFCRHLGCALPLINLRDSEVRIDFEFATAMEVGVLPDNFSATVYADYVILDSPERKLLGATTQDYLVEQVQYNYVTLPDGVPSTAAPTFVEVPLKLFRPVKSLYWMIKNTTPSSANKTHHGRYIGDATGTFLAYQPNPFDMSQFGLLECISERLAPLLSATLMINGQNRFTQRSGAYFHKVQPYNHLPKTVFPGMYSYSFAIRPSDLQPTGTCNFSAVESASLQVELKQNTTADVRSAAFAGTKAMTLAKNIDELRLFLVMAINYNVMRVEGGRASLLM